MNVRLRETQAFAELTEMKQKVMELETQVPISANSSECIFICAENK